MRGAGKAAARLRGFVLGGGVLLAGAANLAAPGARADPPPGFEVIVNVANPASALPREWVADIFLKKVTRWDDGQAIRPVDLPADAEVRRLFSTSVLLRSVAAVRTYWGQRIFSGREVPPPELDADGAVVQYVARYPGAIGYVAVGAQLVGAKTVAVR